MTIRRYLFSIPIFLVIYTLQEAFISQLRLPLGGFSILLIFTLIWATLSTPEVGALTGFGAGILMDLSQSSPGPMGHWTLVLILAGYGVAFLGYGDDNIRTNPINIVLITTAGVVASQLCFPINWFITGPSSRKYFSCFISTGGIGILDCDSFTTSFEDRFIYTRKCLWD
jgi:rod shape-determining protein MreD